MLILGVDPGVDGAAVILDDKANHIVAVIDLPVIRARSLAWIDGAVLGDWIEEWHPELAIVELISYWAGDKHMGYTSALVRIAGGVEAIVSALSIPMVHAGPSHWKKRAGLKGKDPAGSIALARARLSWPDGEVPHRVTKDHNRADAGLIALFGRAPAAAVKPASGPRSSWRSQGLCWMEYLSDEEVGRKIRGSWPWQHWACKQFRRWGFRARLEVLSCRADGAEAEAARAGKRPDQPDIWLDCKKKAIEVKSRDLRFTSALDYPFNTVFICSVVSLEKIEASGVPRAGLVVISKPAWVMLAIPWCPERWMRVWTKEQGRFEYEVWAAKKSQLRPMKWFLTGRDSPTPGPLFDWAPNGEK